VTLDRVLTWFIRLWVGLVILLNVVAMIGFMWAAPTVWAGIAKIQDIYNPYNVWNFVAEAVAVSPALGALAWRERRRARAGAPARK